MTEANESASQIRLIVGLGNPGAEYARTRHNAGFWFVDRLVERHGTRFRSERRFHGESCRIDVDGVPVRVFKPLTYMNRSGAAIRAYSAYSGIGPAEILIVHDELDLPLGTARLKRGGGPGGHNGLRDIISQIGRDFLRLRLGIGHPGSAHEVIDYVLERATADEEREIHGEIEAALEIVPVLLGEGEQKAMTRLHTKTRLLDGQDAGTDGPAPPASRD